MAVAVSTLLPDLRIELPGIAEPVLESYTFQGLRRFFWESEAWKYTSDNGLDYTLNQQTINMPVAGTDIPANTVIKRLDYLLFDSGGTAWEDVVEFKTTDQLDRYDRDWWVATGTEPQYWTYHNGVPIVYPIASATVTTALLPRVIIAPNYTSTASTLPDLLYYENEDAIKAGILADLMRIPGKDWSNPERAVYYKNEYRKGVNNAKSRAQADYGQPDRTMAYGGL